ncbi:hypothetical protein [Thalassospira sp. MIT1370]|uniref:hypothetical protein n=1 Tax=unclassified Thalassospira TaxID=2648997 RepID=UPI0039998715
MNGTVLNPVDRTGGPIWQMAMIRRLKTDWRGVYALLFTVQVSRPFRGRLFNLPLTTEKTAKDVFLRRCHHEIRSESGFNFVLRVDDGYVGPVAIACLWSKAPISGALRILQGFLMHEVVRSPKLGKKYRNKHFLMILCPIITGIQ